MFLFMRSRSTYDEILQTVQLEENVPVDDNDDEDNDDVREDSIRIHMKQDQPFR